MTNYANIPTELTSLPNWVCACADSKLPVQADCAKLASVNDKDTWSTFNTAVGAVNNGVYDYCGFVFTDNGLIGIDIDGGYDSDGFLTQTAVDIVGKCQSYTERSRSGKGLHVIMHGDLPFPGRNNRTGVEIYKTGRYFIMTGDVILYRTIRANQGAIDYVLDKYFPEMKPGGNGTVSPRVYSPTWELPEAGNKIKLQPTYPPIPVGCRNISLTSLAGQLQFQGYTPQQILDELVRANQMACDTPLDDTELQTICRSVTRYAR